MPKLPRVKASEVIRALERLGFVQVRQKGSHVILKKQVRMKDGKETQVSEIGCVVPLPRKAIAVGTLSNILNQANVSVEELIDNL
ncbi:MAG: type II toxin-antitoxin system HicA family toxin [Cyanobacteria bacterium CAN_BIN43]|nr:type II toxin-antitoxin system HicA family toxin [Cyanobacteria bacterium CAN_BIN43]